MTTRDAIRKPQDGPQTSMLLRAFLGEPFPLVLESDKATTTDFFIPNNAAPPASALLLFWSRWHEQKLGQQRAEPRLQTVPLPRP
jgi:hypothetical protein